LYIVGWICYALQSNKEPSITQSNHIVLYHEYLPFYPEKWSLCIKAFKKHFQNLFFELNTMEYWYTIILENLSSKHMNLELQNLVLCRTPVFSLEDNLTDKWSELKTIIGDSSPDFYKIIESVDANELVKLQEKFHFSVWKYFNRARYRATPFGRFAAFSLLPTFENGDMQVLLNQNMFLHNYVGWKEKDAHYLDDTALLQSSEWFQINSTVYRLGKDYRYVRIKNGIFEIASVVDFPELNTVIKLCREKIAKELVYRKMIAKFQLQRRAIDSLLLQMLSLQLLLTEKSPNITGEDYFKRTNLGIINPGDTYVIAERKIISGGLDSRKFKDVPELIDFLAKCLPNNTHSALNDFRLAFLKKFGQRAVPLTVAMDLETGIGYDNLGEQQTDYPYVDMSNEAQKETKTDLHITYTKLHCFLLNKLMNGSVIQLEEFEDRQTAPLPLPNTLSILLHFWKGQPVIQSAGGCTANALLGRFTIANNELEEFGRRIACLEEQANPDVLFFDIAYVAEKDVDNINRRKQLYRYELPILSWSCDPAPLHLDDILVVVRGLEIILWSKKHKKRMIPRMPSAYNYTRSDLAVFRFLCDLQHQHVKSDLNFKMQYFFPDLSFYPRVTFKSVIVSPAMWLLPHNILEGIKTGNQKDNKINLLSWLHQEKINYPFKAGHADQMLYFDPEVDADMDAFLFYCRQNVRKQIYISEALISDEDGLHDNSGKKYAVEFVANYSRKNQVYKPFQLTTSGIESKQQDDQTILPGGDWLYFEVYCHPARADYLLINQLTTFLKESQNKIQKWFFIRYDDPKPHVRLRLRLIDTADGYLIMGRLKTLLEPDCEIGLISDIQVKTYIRETERYGASHMELIEWFFFADSKYVLELLAVTKDSVDLYAVALAMMQSLIALALTDINDQVDFSKNIADQFSEEMNLNQVSFKRLNRRFQDLKPKINIDANTSLISLPHELKSAFISILHTCKSKYTLKKLLTDILHMHVNRLFNSHQRAHEATLYHFLVKVLMTRRALLTVRQECSSAP
jgi:thiopeptide-type bacteriocin biosynthesis protein